MKKIFPILLIAVLALTGCTNKNPYAGTYTGNFTFFKFFIIHFYTTKIRKHHLPFTIVENKKLNL